VSDCCLKPSEQCFTYITARIIDHDEWRIIILKEQKEAWNPNNVFLSVAICQPTDCFFSELALKYLTW
jgi:hypothetical protein